MAQTHRSGAMKQFLRFPGESRGSLGILLNRPRARGAAYFAPPHQVGPVFDEFRQIPRNQSKRRKSQRAGGMGPFLRSPGGSRDFLKILRGRPRIRGVAYFAPPRHVGPVSE